MKTIIRIVLWVAILGLVISTPRAYSVTHVIQVSNFSFTPQTINNVQLGDVIRYVWITGFHTTTSSSIPAGATPWDVVMSAGNTVFDYTPAVAGTYNYVCTPHAAGGMIGSFTVTIPGPSTRTSTQSGNWSSTSTWGGNPVPTSADAVIINGGFTVTVDVPNASCASVQVGGSTSNAGTGGLTFANGSHLTISGALNIGPFNNNNTAGSLTMTSGGTLTTASILVGRLGSWLSGTGTIEFSGSNTLPSNTNAIFNNLTMSSGTTTLSHNLTVTGDLLINPGATLDGAVNTLNTGGNWINNGTFTGNTGTVIFDKIGNATITGTGLNNFNLLKVDMGTTITNTLEVLSSQFSAAAGFLNIVNGTFKMSGSYTFANTFFTGPSYNIQPTAGIWINNPNVTVNAQAGNISVRGLLRITSGTYNIGTSINNSLSYVDGSSILIEGGTLTIAGQLTRNNATATTSFTQSGGTLTVAAQGSTDPTYGCFDLGAVGSTFTMSGGTLIIRNATSAPADFVNASSISTVTGGTLQIGDASSLNAQLIRIQTSGIIGNLLVSNATSQGVKPSAKLVTSGLNVIGNLTLQSGTTLIADGLNISTSGNWVNNGTFSSGGNTVSFTGAGTQTLTNPSGELFNNLTINKTGGSLTLNNTTNVNGEITLASGALAIGATTLNINGGITTTGGTLSGGAGSTLTIGGSGATATIPAATLNNLTINRLNGLLLSGDLNINGTLSCTTGTITTGTNSVILGSSANLSEIAGQPILGIVRTTRNITATSGVESFGNLGADLTLNGIAPGSTTALRKTGILSAGNGHTSIKRYFDITPSTNTGLNAGLVYHYDVSELNGQNANILELYKSTDNGSSWLNLGGEANAALHTVTLSGINDFARITGSDTSNRIGNTGTPVITSLTPSSKNLGEAAFTLTVNGNGFAEGKSNVRFNGNSRSTVFVNTNQLTASITAADLLTLGVFPVTVFNTGGGGLSNAQNFTVAALPATKINIETAANGSGSIVSAQNLTYGSAITVYAISRDALNNFVANVAASAWSLENITGGVVAGDLVPSADNKSAVFTAFLAGTAQVKAISGILTPTTSGIITVLQPTSTTITGTITYKNNANTPITNSIIELKQNGITVAQATTDASGHYTFSNLSNGTYLINCNISKTWGGVNSVDALMILKKFVGLITLTGLNLKAADVDGSQFINSIDPLIVSRRFVSIISSFSVGDWQTESNLEVINAPSINIVNLKVLCTGDVDGSFIPAQ